MFRFLFRLLALCALAVAVIFAVLDATRSIAASTLVATPLNTSWIDVSPGTLATAHDFVARNIHPLAWDPVIVRILDLPGFAVFALLALLFHAMGHRPGRRTNRLPA
jgi:hypothetical protein